MKRWVLIALAAVGIVVPMAQADSIWDRRDPRYAYLFQDNRARQVGDVLTVVVSENTVANEQDQRALEKSSSASLTADYSGSTSSGGGAGRSAVASLSMSGSSNRQFNGSAQFTANRVFTDRMAVTVVDIMPNGNLVVEGYRSRVVAGEERVLRMTGVVRQQDVGVGNLVTSASIANLRISYLGRGPATRTTKQGYLGRMMNVLWPF
jgi:flagellar L-ring protein precursor FlgH